MTLKTMRSCSVANDVNALVIALALSWGGTGHDPLMSRFEFQTSLRSV